MKGAVTDIEVLSSTMIEYLHGEFQTEFEFHY